MLKIFTFDHITITLSDLYNLDIITQVTRYDQANSSFLSSNKVDKASIIYICITALQSTQLYPIYQVMAAIL